MADFRLTSVLLIGSLASFTTAVATCYRSDNHQSLDSIYTPCNSQTPFSMCQRSQKDSVGSPAGSACYANGIIQNINTIDNQIHYDYWRQGCTDPTWKSPYCLKAFDACESDRNDNVKVTPCGNNAAELTRWCCGRNNTACCSGNPIVIAASLGPVSIMTTRSSTSTSSSTSTPSSTSSSDPAFLPSLAQVSVPASKTSPPQTLAPEKGLSTAVKAGIGIGAAVIAIAALTGAVFFALRKRRRTLKYSVKLLHEIDYAKSPAQLHIHEVGDGEHLGESAIHEISGNLPFRQHNPYQNSPIELDSSMVPRYE